MKQKPASSARAKPTKKAQYERFKETARELGCDNPKSAEEFERAFKKIVPSKSQSPKNI